MCYEKRLLEGKCYSCLQAYERLLLLHRRWLLRVALALPFSRASFWLHSFQSSWPFWKRVHRTCPHTTQTQPQGSQASLSVPRHLTFMAIHGQLPHSPFPHSLPPHRPCWWPTVSIKFSLAWIWISLPLTTNSTDALSTYVSGSVLTVLLKNISFILQTKILTPKQNKIISSTSYS